jgi:uncharacterized protein (DUF885 family)
MESPARNGSGRDAANEARRALHSYCDQSFAQLLAASPEVATELGLTEIAGTRLRHDGWSDLSPRGAAHRRALMRQTLEGLVRLAATAEATRLDRDVYEFFLRWGRLGRLLGVESTAFEHCDYVADHLSGAPFEAITCLLDWQPLEDEDDAEAWLSRLATLSRHLDTVSDALRERASLGNVMPRCIVERVVAGITSLLEVPVERSPLLLRYRAARPNEGLDAVAEMLQRGVYPAYAALRELLQSDYAFEDRLGVGRMRDGEAWYAFLLKAHTTSDLSTERVHDIGRRELEYLQAEVRQRLDRAGFAGDTLQAQFAAFDADPRVRRVPASTREQVLAGIEAIVRHAEAELRSLFGLVPRAPLIVRAIPAEQEGNRHTAYVPPTADGSRPGAFEVNVRQQLGAARYDDYTLVYHEAIPGHHLQLTIAQERESLPMFRRALVHDGYIEGWAKYSEQLPWLEGINEDPLWDIARRRSELYSTANLVLDTSIHTRGWTREQGIQFFAANTGCTREFAAAIVDRVAARPAQACAYKIGLLAMREARRRIESAEGAAFDRRRFHDLVLEQGSLPLALFEARIAAAVQAPESGHTARDG